MEKRTIGKFIAVLRKANGLTQADLAEKPFVSDKTVSRWERDESAPDLELIPVIADLFGVTTDELLRGERINASNIFENQTEEETESNREKTEKRYKQLLSKKFLKFKNLSFISYGIALIGFIVAVIFIFCVDSDKIDETVMGAWISVACLIIATLCQIVFTNLAAYREEDEEEFIKAISDYRIRFTDFAVKSFLRLSAVFGLTLPLFFVNASSGDNYNTVLPFVCLLLAAVFPLIGSFGYRLYQKAEQAKNKLSVEQWQAVTRLKRKCFLPVFLVSLVLLASMAGVFYGTSAHHFAKAKKFNDSESFIAYMEKKEDFGDLDKEPFHGSTTQSHGSDGFYFSEHGEWTKLGRTDQTFFWANQSVVGYTVSNNKDCLPVKVYERKNYEAGDKLRQSVIFLMPVLTIVSIGIGFTIYTIKRKKMNFNK